MKDRKDTTIQIALLIGVRCPCVVDCSADNDM